MKTVSEARAVKEGTSVLLAARVQKPGLLAKSVPTLQEEAVTVNA
jgi:hypothetical protein